MLARLQRFVVLAVTLVALGWLAPWWWQGRPAMAIVGAAGIGLSYTLVLALEFMLLACVHGRDETPRAGPLQLLRAWLGECVVAWQVFVWRQPFRSGLHPDVPGRPGVRGIVFVHGYVCNRGLWGPWLVRCTAERRPFVAVNLEPVFSDLDVYVPQLEAAVARLERETGLPPLLVCHSMGGLVARAWLAALPGTAARVQHVITIATPHRGTWLARLSRTTNSRHMRQASEWLTGLASREPALHTGRFTCFYGHADNIVFPPRVATLPGADNRHLRATAHVAMVFHPEVVSEAARWLATTDAAISAGVAAGEPR
ncbi:esterase/lipase family protein [Methylibium sp.]|uniref:esterase/lipase family protein n=1 Tax=Methylibium sp. TaxID=2067992 RepID=UPI003D09E9E1